MTDEPYRIAFVCVQNAGRSQMAAAFAERERSARALAPSVEIYSGGTDPATQVHDVVVEAMGELGIDLAGRTPREITKSEIDDMDMLITMGCSVDDVCPATWRGDTRDWGLDDPAGKPIDEVRDIRDEVRARVNDHFNELERNLSPPTVSEGG